jgi:Insulin-induced protein (INSIG)
MGDSPHIHRPTPRRLFEISPPTPISTDYSIPPSPSPENQNPDYYLGARLDSSLPPTRTRSILNLTSSTLFGIYSPTGHDISQEASTPWGTGAQTPSQRRSVDEYRPQMPNLNWNGKTQKAQSTQIYKPRRTGFRGYYVPLFFRNVLLFAFGVAYGIIITQLQRTRPLTSVGVKIIRQHPWYFHAAWGLSGILLGNALPWVDAALRASETPVESRPNRSSSDPTRKDPDTATEWSQAIRGVGAFVGIAFAVRKLPWQSTLQVSLTLALANPLLWYLVDRSKAGFAFSAAVGVVGTMILLLVKPDMVPLPSTVGLGPGIKNVTTPFEDMPLSESVGVFTWMASILFCTSVCFGAIGRKIQS